MSHVTFNSLADVLLSSTGGPGPWQAMTNAQGKFVAGLTPGRYLVTFSKEGFAPQVLSIIVPDADLVVAPVLLVRADAPPPLDPRIADLTAQLTNLKATLATSTTLASQLQAQLHGDEDAIVALRSTLTTQQAKLDTTSASLATALADDAVDESTIATLRTQVHDDSVTIQALQAQIIALTPVVIPPVGPVLTSGRLQYVGVFKAPYDLPNTAFGFANGAFTARRVNGELRFLMAGFKNYGFPVVEFAYPGVGPDVASAPRASLLRNWGSCYLPMVVDSVGVASSMGSLRALHWANDQLYWAYGDEYNAAGNHDPCIGSTILNEDGTFQAFGTWRTQEHCQKTRGYMLGIPKSFQQAYGIGPVGFGCPNTSGNASSPWGVALATGTMPTNATPADPLGPGGTMSDKFSIANQRLIFHDINHPQPRQANYKYCGWGGSDAGGHYDPSTGYTKPGAPSWLDIDQVTAAVWVDLPDVQGFIAFGQTVDTIPGYPYEDGDTLSHAWYGPPICPHGQIGGPVSISVGPAAGSMVPRLWIYDPADLAKVATGVIDPNQIWPTEETPLYTISPLQRRASAIYQFSAAYFDAETRSIFLSEVGVDHPDPYSPSPVIHQFVIT